jgi:hypothetical protein
MLVDTITGNTDANYTEESAAVRVSGSVPAGL